MFGQLWSLIWENFRVVIDILFGDKFFTCVGHFCLLTKCRLVLDILFVDKSFWILGWHFTWCLNVMLEFLCQWAYQGCLFSMLSQESSLFYGQLFIRPSLFFGINLFYGIFYHVSVVETLFPSLWRWTTGCGVKSLFVLSTCQACWPSNYCTGFLDSWLSIY